MLVQGYDGHLIVTLIFYPTSILGEGMYYMKQRQQQKPVNLAYGEVETTFRGKLHAVRTIGIKIQEKWERGK